MEKELKFCSGVFLRVDLTWPGQFSQSADFCQKGWDGCALLGQSSKGHPCRISTIFPLCSTTLLVAPLIKKLETYFALLYFWTFAQCGAWPTFWNKWIMYGKFQAQDSVLALVHCTTEVVFLGGYSDRTRRPQWPQPRPRTVILPTNLRVASSMPRPMK